MLWYSVVEVSGRWILMLYSIFTVIDEKMLYLNTDQEKDRTNFIDKDVRTCVYSNLKALILH